MRVWCKVTNQTTRNLIVKLTDQQRDVLGRNLAELHHKRNFLEEQKKSAMELFKTQLNEVSDLIDETADAVNSGTEWRDVPCEWVYHYDLGYKALIRTDTMEPVDRAPITDQERQLHFDEV